MIVPSIEHEVPLELIRDRPELIAKLAREHFGLAIHAGATWRLGPETVSVPPCELSMDLLAIGERADRIEGLLIHEVQLSGKREDLDRISHSWPVYVTHSRRQFRCPVALLAFCPTELVADRVATTIETGHPDFDLRPLTYWPGALKITEDIDQAREWPELVVLALTDERAPDDRMTARIIQAAFETLGLRRHDNRAIYFDYISDRIPKEQVKELIDLMALSQDTYEWKSEFALQHRSEGQAIGEEIGEARGEAAAGQRAVLHLLNLRDIEVPQAVREQLASCTEPALLDELLARALDIDVAEQLFHERG